SGPDFLKVPMLAMSLLLCCSSPRPSRPRWRSAGRRRSTTHPSSGRSAAEDGGGETFLPREEWAKPRGRKSHRRRCGSGDRGAAVLWPDQPKRGRGRAPNSIPGEDGAGGEGPAPHQTPAILTTMPPAAGASAAPRIGAAWSKQSNEGRPYLSLKLDDPS